MRLKTNFIAALVLIGLLITSYQDLYNHQHARTLTVDQNLRIDTSAAEKWLGDHALSMLGIDATHRGHAYGIDDTTRIVGSYTFGGANYVMVGNLPVPK